jgi:hypothetical protein
MGQVCKYDFVFGPHNSIKACLNMQCHDTKPVLGLYSDVFVFTLAMVVLYLHSDAQKPKCFHASSPMT